LPGSKEISAQALLIAVLCIAAVSKLAKSAKQSFQLLLERFNGAFNALPPAAALGIALACFAASCLVAALALREARGRRSGSYVWLLTHVSERGGLEALSALQVALREKLKAWGAKGHLVFTYFRGGLSVAVCAQGLTSAQAEFVESYLKTLEPAVKWKRVRGNCPDYELASVSSANDVAAAKALMESAGKGLRLEEEKADPSAELLFARSKRDGSLVGLKVSDLFRHVGIFGSTGSGKTTTAATVAAGASLAGLAVLVLDWHGEYEEVLSKLFGRSSTLIKVTSVKPVSERAAVNPLEGELEDVVSELEDVFQLTQPQASVLLRTLKELKGVKSLHQLIAVLDPRYEDSYWERELKLALLRRLEPIDSAEGRVLFSDRASPPEPRPGVVTIVDLSEIRSYALRKLYALALLRRVYQRVQASRGSGPGVLVVIDEAHNLLPKSSENFIARVLAEGRKFKLGLVVVTQSPSSINTEFIKNLNTKIVHAIKTGLDARIVGESMGLSTSALETLVSLSVGEAFFSSPSTPAPLLVVVEPGLTVSRP